MERITKAMLAFQSVFRLDCKTEAVIFWLPNKCYEKQVRGQGRYDVHLRGEAHFHNNNSRLVSVPFYAVCSFPKAANDPNYKVKYQLVDGGNWLNRRTAFLNNNFIVRNA